jgi:hypothetical protein
MSEPRTALNGVDWGGDWTTSFFSVTYAFSYVFRKVGCSYGMTRTADVALLPNIGKRIPRGLSCGLFIVALLPNIGNRIPRGLSCGLFIVALLSNIDKRIHRGLFCGWLTCMAEK